MPTPLLAQDRIVRRERLADVLAEFAHTMATDFPIQRILEHLAARIMEILPVCAVGVTLVGPDRTPRYIAASDDVALRFSRLQTELGDGPCLLAFDRGRAIAVPDLLADQRFPRFGPAACAAGLVAVFTFPLRREGGQLGALDLYRETTGPMDPEDLLAAQTLADVAAAYLLNAQARDEARVTTERLQHKAFHDALTGLPNRSLLEERLEHAAQRAHRTRSGAAVLLADLDHFKRVNDEHGHAAGDDLLRSVARRLSGLMRPGDTLARLSGDEFVILCEDLRGPADAERLAERIVASFTQPFLLAGRIEVTLTASIGIAFSSAGEPISHHLLVDADRLMYRVKRGGGGGHQIIDLREPHPSEDEERLGEDLRRAVSKGELRVVYQPLVRPTDGTVTGVEALLRWEHPDRGPIDPTLLVGLAERTGMIAQIGLWVLARACRDRHTWLVAAPGSPLDLSVNVSGRQLVEPEFAPAVASVLRRTSMDPAALVVEVTETVFLDSREAAVTALTALRTHGVRIALDDFGTGYSSLSYLRHLPIDIVKIDRSFIDDATHQPGEPGRVILEGVANIARGLGLSVTAEGVETDAQRETTVEVGCSSAQGFLFAAGMDSAAIRALVVATGAGVHPHLPTAAGVGRFPG